MPKCPICNICSFVVKMISKDFVNSSAKNTYYGCYKYNSNLQARKMWMNNRRGRYVDIDADEELTGIKGLPGCHSHGNPEMTSLKKK